MSRRAPALAIGLFAFLSGIPALVYQVVWTRQVALLAGGQIEAISVVLVAFFGGLALGANYYGRLSDRSPSPLRLYGLLEIGGALLAAISVWTLRELGANPHLSSASLLGASAALLLPTTFLIGGTLPALLRCFSADPESTGGRAGMLVGANTIGAVFGVAVAVASIPAVGMRASLLAAATGALVIGGAALAFAQPPVPAVAAPRRSTRAGTNVLGAAFVVGVATLGFEVLAARLATVRLGSSLYAWGLVLALFLIGLATGNLALARRARNSTTSLRDLGWIEVAAACSVAFGLALLRPDIASPTAALSRGSLALVAVAVLPATFCMGGAFPILVRLAVRDLHIGAAFGRLSAVNTFGGIVGALLTPFVMLPALGAIRTGIAFAVMNAGVGLIFLAAGNTTRKRMTIAVACLVIAGVSALRTPTPAEDPWVLFVAEGRQATAVVTSSRGNRTLVVDGDPEASTVGNARRTEELLAILPLLIHPRPERFLEIGLGSGITLGTATRFPLAQIHCVEIADAVIRSASYFEPDNRGVANSLEVELIHADARRLLAATHQGYDVISANTLHPWSIGATGLYSREYFVRIAEALRPGGIAVQWLPTEQIGSESLSLILRTFFDVFPEGGLWWGAGNVIALGSRDRIPNYDPRQADARLARAGLSWRRLGWTVAEDLPTHRIADADAIRTVLGAGDLLLDDRPLLELHAARGRVVRRSSDLYEILVTMAEQNIGNGAMLFWLESLALRASGDEAGADTREGLAADLGLQVARHARLSRRVARAQLDAQEGRLDSAARGFDSVLAIDPDQRYARFARAGLAIQRGDLDGAISDLERVVKDWPDDVRAWTELAGALSQSGDRAGARHAIEQALVANPFGIRALVHAGLIAAKSNDRDRARSMLARIRAVSPLGQSQQEKLLTDVLDKIEGP